MTELDLKRGTSWAEGLGELQGFISIDNCEISFCIGKRDEIITKQRSSQVFRWSLKPESWEIVKGLIEPFYKDTETRSKFHQWLAGKEASYGFHKSKIALLITNREDGSW